MRRYKFGAHQQARHERRRLRFQKSVPWYGLCGYPQILHNGRKPR